MDSSVTGNGWYGVHLDSTVDSTPPIGGGKADPGQPEEQEVEKDHGVPTGAGMG